VRFINPEIDGYLGVTPGMGRGRGSGSKRVRPDSPQMGVFKGGGGSVEDCIMDVEVRLSVLEDLVNKMYQRLEGIDQGLIQLYRKVEEMIKEAGRVKV
jgi:hypothetical protein